jgi:hypothetical protein
MRNDILVFGTRQIIARKLLFISSAPFPPKTRDPRGGYSEVVP